MRRNEDDEVIISVPTDAEVIHEKMSGILQDVKKKANAGMRS